MLSTLTDTTVHGFNAISRSVAKSITIKTSNFAATHCLMARSIASATGRNLSIVVQTNLEFPKA